MLFNAKPSTPSKSQKAKILQGFVTLFLFVFVVCLAAILGSILEQRATLNPSDLEDLEDFTFLQDIKAGQVDEALKVVRAIEKFNNLTNREKLENFKWRPLASKFERVQEYLELTGQNGTYHEKFLYMSTPTFRVLPGGKMNVTFSLGTVSIQHQYRGKKNIHSTEWKIAENGLQDIANIFYEKGKVMETIRCYYIPVEDMLKI